MKLKPIQDAISPPTGQETDQVYSTELGQRLASTATMKTAVLNQWIYADRVIVILHSFKLLHYYRVGQI